MSDLILIDGDTVTFLPNFGAAVVVVRPGTLAGSGRARIGGKPVCVAGDEAKVSVPGCLYTTPQYVIPGTGTLKIDSVASNQTAGAASAGGKKILLKGSVSAARFEVQSPAQQPPPGPGAPIPDATPSYRGSFVFVPANATVKAQ